MVPKNRAHPKSMVFSPKICINYRLKKTHTREIWATHAALLAKLVPVAFDYRSWTKRPKCASAKRYRRICRSNKSTAAVRRCASKYLVQLRAWHSHHCRVWKLSIHRRPKNPPNRMPNIFQIHLDSFRLAELNNTDDARDFRCKRRMKMPFLWNKNLIYQIN